MNATSPLVSESRTKSFLLNPTRRTLVQNLNYSNEIQRHEVSMTANDNGDEKISPPKIRTSQIEDRLVMIDITNKLYMSLSSTIFLNWKKEMLYVPLDFKNGSTIDALVDSGAYVGAITQSELDRIKQQARVNNFKMDDPPDF